MRPRKMDPVTTPDNGDARLGSTINQSERPRLLIYGFDDDDELVERLLALVPTARRINGFWEVRQMEWDVLVTDRSLTYSTSFRSYHAEPHLCVIYCHQAGTFGRVVEKNEWRHPIQSWRGHVAQELIRIRGLPDGIAHLVHEQLEPVLKARESHIFFEGDPTEGDDELAIGEPTPDLEPFIVTADHKFLAGRYRRSADSETWLLPGDIPDLLPWVRAALAEWHALAPDRFPGVPEWSETEMWQTSTERSLHAELAELGAERTAALAQFTDREKALREKLRSAKDAADLYERALLTTQSNELAVAVAAALRELGFTVVNADNEAAPDDHLEDLRVHDPDVPGWTALVEVKGYTKGAKTEALTQFIRFNVRYMQREGRAPDACWYIVNQFLARDPATRQRVLHGKDEDVSAFASSHGLVIDTVTLFGLLARVRDGHATAEDMRARLRDMTGRFTLD